MVFKRTGFIQSREIKSRRDGILLTVDFNLRNVKTLHATSLQSPLAENRKSKIKSNLSSKIKSVVTN